ncbi:MAG TPA: SRPBCC domain-containing protein [Saprospiraceae bacterium]|nr:SRPBCC domain-containing protein [Saprospiraceae bacterium]HPN69561.1 SRPBCC domain-containing protein [Saprospiraceae bacterium]
MSFLQFDFRLDSSTNTVFIQKAFDAELPLVWDAFTKQEILDQWWAPKPYDSKTIVMEFKEGGRRFYAMISPEGQENYQLQQYTSITPKTNFKYFSVFADQDENPFLPGSNWDLNFSEENGITTVDISIHNESQERLQRMIEMGFKEGFTMTLNELANLLASLKK